MRKWEYEGMELIFYCGREWECFYMLLREWDGNRNTVMGMGGNEIGKVIPAHRYIRHV